MYVSTVWSVQAAERAGGHAAVLGWDLASQRAIDQVCSRARRTAVHFPALRLR